MSIPFLYRDELATFPAAKQRAILAAHKAGAILLKPRPAIEPWALPDWHPQPKQADLLNCTADECFFGGARGGGKTDAAANYSIRRRKDHPGSSGVILRRTFPMLFAAGGIFDRLSELLSGIAVWRAGVKRFVFPDGGFIALGYAPDTWEKFKEMAQGLQVDDIVIEEAGQWEQREIQILMSSVRATVEGIRTQTRLTGNPGGRGHGFLKTYFVEAGPKNQVWTPKPTKEQPNPRSRCFIESKLVDNAILEKRDPLYRSFLEGLPETDRLAWLDGRWDIFVGQYFTEWSPDVHIADPWDVIPNWDPNRPFAEQIPSWWSKTCALDWGFSHPLVVYWGATDPDNRSIIYRELRVRGLHVKGDDGMIARLREYPDTPFMVGAGPDVFGLQSEMLAGPTIAEDFAMGVTLSDGRRLRGYSLTNVMKGRTRRHGWQQVRRFLQWRGVNGQPMKGHPLLRVLRGTCPALEACIPNMIHSEKDPEDMLKQDIDQATGLGGDDPADGLRHWCMSRPWIGGSPDSVVAPAGSPARNREEDERREAAEQSGRLDL